MSRSSFATIADLDTVVDRDSTEYVAWVQRSLNYLIDAGLVVDGVTGPRTQAAVASFQRSYGLTDDGVVGPRTEAFLIEAGADLPPTAADEDPPELRARIIDLALAERRRWRDGALAETDPGAYNMLTEYWRQGLGLSAVDAERAIAQRYAWSAAFICWVLRRAGAGSGFAYSSFHSTYIAAAYQNRVQQSASAFKAYSARELLARPGDLLCTTYPVNGVAPSASLSQVRANTSGYHCDIVVQSAPGRLTLLGGNVADTVGMKTARTDARGFPITAEYFAVLTTG